MSAKSRVAISVDGFKPLADKVFVTDLDRGVKKTATGIILPDDDMTERGIRDRWAKVYAVGPQVEDIKVGEWILVKHGRWTERIAFESDEGTVYVWRVDYPDAVLAAADEDPRENQTVTDL